MPDIIEVHAEPIVECTVVNNIPQNEIIKILKEDAIGYAQQRDVEKEFVDFYKHIKTEIYEYRYNKVFNNSDCENEIEAHFDDFNEKYLSLKEQYLHSKVIYGYAIRKLEELNNKYYLNIDNDIRDIKDEYNETDDESDNDDETENQNENPED